MALKKKNYIYSIRYFQERKEGPSYRYIYVVEDMHQNVKLITSGLGKDSEPKEIIFSFHISLQYFTYPDENLLILWFKKTI